MPHQCRLWDVKRSRKYRHFELSLKLLNIFIELSKLFLDIDNLAGNSSFQLLLEGADVFTEAQEPIGAGGPGLDEFFHFL